MNTKSGIIREIMYFGKKCIVVRKMGYDMVGGWEKV